jgi:type I restriction enzyme S subunit
LYPYYGATGQVGLIDDFLIDGEYILIGEDGAPFLDFYKKKAYKIQGKSWVNNHAHILKGKNGILNDDFALFYLNSINYENFVNGTTRLKLTKSSLINIPFVLPPLPEQEAIVAKIEELFSELDRGKEQLEIALAQLKVYRQSLLQAAFSGKLTHSDVKEGELPEGWVIKKLNDIGNWKGGGTPSKSNKVFWENGNILWVSPKDMKSRIIRDTVDKITAGAIENSSTRLIPQGSILFVIRSGILRRTLPVALTITDVTVNQDLQAFTPNDALPEYIYWYVLGKNDDIRKTCSKDGTTVESIESSSLRNYLIQICSLEEQEQIVEILESKLTVCDKMEETIRQSLAQVDVMKQSILKKAFEGSLVGIVVDP